jgi:hypothetical protein
MTAGVGAAAAGLEGADFAGAAAGDWAVRGRVKAARQTERAIERTKPPGKSNTDVTLLDPAEGKMVPGDARFWRLEERF